MNSEDRSCPTCDGTMSPIQIIDKQGAHPESSGFEYAAIEAKRGFWSGAYPKSGKLNSYLCNDCGYVAIFASKSS